MKEDFVKLEDVEKLIDKAYSSLITTDIYCCALLNRIKTCLYTDLEKYHFSLNDIPTSTSNGISW